jgi:hypothetical protein
MVEKNNEIIKVILLAVLIGLSIVAIITNNNISKNIEMGKVINSRINIISDRLDYIDMYYLLENKTNTDNILFSGCQAGCYYMQIIDFENFNLTATQEKQNY